MSSYQHHEFLAIDRALSDAQIRELRAISSRAEIAPARFAYDTAVALLLDLRAIAARDNRLTDFTNRLSALYDRHRRKSTFVARLRKAGLVNTPS